MIRVGVVGYGHWGPNCTRVLTALDEAELAFVCDSSQDRCGVAAQRYPGVVVTPSLEVALAQPDLDAVVVATPAETHAVVALAAMSAGRHVLVEKPLGMDATEIESLASAADAANLVLMVDHTYVFSDAVAELRSLVETGVLDAPFAYRSVRTNPAHVAGRVGVLRDLAVHDLSILDVLHTMPPTTVAASRPETTGVDTIELRLAYADGSTAAMTVGWGTAERSREVILESEHATVVYGDARSAPEVQVFPPGDTSRAGDVDDGARVVAMAAPNSGEHEPLHRALGHFLASIASGEPPCTDANSALRVAHVLDAGRQSLAVGGDEVMPVELEALG